MLRTRYPGFLFGLPLAAGEIPVFVFHDVEVETFTRQLEFLGANGYRTLSLEEFLALSSRKSGASAARSVLLTFDDARLNFHQSALPALRATRSRAALFAPTLWMGTPRAAAPERFMSWGQLKECVESGLVDVASHAHRHALVFDSDRLAGFATPALLERYDIYDWPMRHDGGLDSLGRPVPGTPIYGAAPLLSARTRYLESAALREACIGLVERSGAAEFFSRPDCYSRLARLHRCASASLRGRFAREEEFEALLASEFELSRAAFEEHLGFAPAAMAYPWELGSPLSVALARRFGLRCLFGVATDYRRARASRARHEPLAVFGRLKCDWLELLPGRNRARLLPVLARKVAGLGQQHLAH
ncbi:MAG TPA: polysaccharide deacetylase family protein [Steroidobacteraceae bacterium]|nr:polysaccharide deacetylase family protein [Steroidobacteraceae bacterium]